MSEEIKALLGRPADKLTWESFYALTFLGGISPGETDDLPFMGD